MRDPTTAAHLLGKLFKHIGEENVLWGTGLPGRHDPTFETYGPKTDSEYEALIAERGGLPT